MKGIKLDKRGKTEPETEEPTGYAEAKSVLRGKLKFGDDEQIRAVNYIASYDTVLETLESYVGRSLKCEDCDGEGGRQCVACGKYGECSSCYGGHVPVEDNGEWRRAFEHRSTLKEVTNFLDYVKSNVIAK